MKIILNKTMRIKKINYYEGDVVEVADSLGKELIEQKKAKSVDASAATVQVKVTVESVKKEFPEVYKAISEAGHKSSHEKGYEEGFKAGVEEASEELKGKVTADLIEKEFPEVYKAILSKGAEKKGK